MGFSKEPLELDDEETDGVVDAKVYGDEMFVWTYSSPEFPMAQVTFLKRLLLFHLYS